MYLYINRYRSSKLAGNLPCRESHWSAKSGFIPREELFKFRFKKLKLYPDKKFPILLTENISKYAIFLCYYYF